MDDGIITFDEFRSDFSDSLQPEIICSIIIVCFHSAQNLAACLDMIKGHTAEKHELIVDSNSLPDHAEIAGICDARGAVFIQNRENVGYGAACNVGARSAKGRYVLFLNPDVRISRASLHLMIELAEANRDLVALGPLQSSSRGDIRGKRRVVGERRSRENRTIRKLSSADTLTPTSFLSGGALMVRKEAFDRIGGFDDKLFLYHEDDDLCLRLKKVGRMAYASGVLVLHDWGTSTPKAADLAKLRSWHLGYSKVYVLQKHYGMLAGYLPLLEAATKFLNPSIITRRGRQKARAFLTGVISSLRTRKPNLDVVPV